ncbi:MAG TPA: VCBS repeat-containing protein, partial [Steroidobacteraceae bacterium]|nr:VCBS repeat-containing protein [Steroidobacteraceae bacterium]
MHTLPRGTHRGRPRRVLAALFSTAALVSCGGGDDNCCFVPFTVPNSVAVADVNGDGVPDLLVATTNDQGYALNPGFANVILNSASSPGTFSSGVQYATSGNNPASIAVADLTGAGALDLVVANVTGSVSVYLHASTPGTYQPAVNITTGGAPNQVVVADVNGDGSPDIVLADISPSGSVLILLQDPANPGQFLSPVKLPTGATTASVQVADLNGDGRPDIVATGYDVYGNNGAVYVFLQSAQGGTFLSPVSYPAGAQPSSVKVADLNGDGRPDLVVADYGPGADGTGGPGASILLQSTSAAGTFGAPALYPTYFGTIDVAVADLNGDGKPDVVTASLGPYPTGAISVLLQDAAQPGTLLAANG